MNAQNAMVQPVDADGKWLYRAGGISALVLGTGYIITIPLYMAVGVASGSIEDRLMALAGNQTGWWAILGLMVFTDILYIPVAFALTTALKAVSRNLMLLAAAFLGLFVVLDLAITWPSYAALITLGGNYAAAAGDAQRAAIVAAASYPYAVLDSVLLRVYILLAPALGILLTGLVMLKGPFGKATAYLGLATGIMGIAATLLASTVGVTVILASVLTTLWALVVGYRLLRLAGEGSTD